MLNNSNDYNAPIGIQKKARIKPNDSIYIEKWAVPRSSLL